MPENKNDLVFDLSDEKYWDIRRDGHGHYRVETRMEYDLETCKKIKDIRGIGLMLGIEFTEPVESIIKEASKSSLLVLSAGENVLRLLPPLIVGREEIDQAVEILTKIIRYPNGVN